MKKNIFLIISLSFIIFISNAQTPTLNWAKQIGSSGTDYGYSIAVHSNGNVYTTGFFTGTVDFDPSSVGTYTLTADSTDIFICKLDASGNFVWAKKMGGPTSKDGGYSIAVDANENVYITGIFKGTANFNPSGTALNLTSAGGLDIFIAKFDVSGTLQWANAMGGPKDDDGYSIAVDANGNVYTTGWFLGTANFNPSGTASNLTAFGTNTTFSQYPWDAFITKHSSSGAFTWVKQLGGTGYEFGSSITLDANKNIFLTGMFTGNSADFDPSTTVSNTLSSAGGGDIFVAKYDLNGAYVWAKKMGGSGDDWGNSITLDVNGNVLTTGVFEATSNFATSGSAVNLTASGATNVYDIFVSKLNGAGNYVWAKSMGGTADDTGLSITTDASGNVYTTGGFKNTVNFDPNGGSHSFTAKGGTGIYDIFISKLDSTGTYAWAGQIGGVEDDEGQSIVVDGNGSIYATGGFKMTADFDPDATATYTMTADSTDAFILKLTQTAACSVATPTVTVTNACGTSTLTSSTTTGTYLWSNGGATTKAITVSSGGTYSVTITENGCTSAAGIGTAAPMVIPATPTVTVTNACGTSTLTSSTTTGTYSWSSGGATTKAITIFASATYSVTITENGCTSASGSGTSAPLIIPATPTVTVSNVCGSSTLTSSNTTGTYLWSPGGKTTNTISVSASAAYSVTITESGCSSTPGKGDAAPTPIPAAPTVSSPVSYCQNSTASALTATGTALLWYTASTGGSGNSTAPTPSTTAIGSTDNYVSQTINTCESPRALITVNITSGTAAPTVTSPVNYCQNDVAAPLTATGTNLSWYVNNTDPNGSGSGTAFTPSTSAIGTISYYVSQTQCGEGPRSKIDVITNVIPTAPTATATDACGSSTLVASNYTGNLKWSTTETTASINVIIAATYSVTQTINGCVSPAGIVTAAPIAVPSAPTVTSAVSYCNNATATQLTATGTALIWYNAASAGTVYSPAPTPSTTSIGATNYYVSQTVNTCESPRALITVSINAIPSAPTVISPVVYCQNATATQLTATGSNLLWYTVASGGTGNSTAPTPLTTTLGSTDYYVSQTVNACESSRASIIVNITASAPAPTVTSPVNYCKNDIATPLTATTVAGASLLWYTTATGGIGSSSTPTPSTSTISSVSYYVSQTLCNIESPRSTLVVVINPYPTVTINATPTSLCIGQSAILTASGASTYVWSNSATTSSITVSPTATATYTVTGKTAGCPSIKTNTVSVTICSGVGIEENSNLQEVTVYPNPTNGEFNIAITNANFKELGVSVVNLLGKEVFNASYKNSATDFNKRVNLTDIAEGIYYIRLSFGEIVKIKKLIIE